MFAIILDTYSELIILEYLVDLVALDHLLHLVLIHVDSVIEVAAPKNVVVSIQRSAHRKGNFPRDLRVVGVPLIDLGLAGGEMCADEAEGGRIEDAANRGGAFVAGGAAEAGLHAIHRNVSKERSVFRSDEEIEADAHQLLICYEYVIVVPRQSLLQLLRPSLRIVRASCHDVARVEIHDFLKADNENVNGVLVVLRCDQSWNWTKVLSQGKYSLKSNFKLLRARTSTLI